MKDQYPQCEGQIFDTKRKKEAEKKKQVEDDKDVRAAEAICAWKKNDGKACKYLESISVVLERAFMPTGNEILERKMED